MQELKQKKVWVNYILFRDPADPDNPKKPPKNPYNGYPAKVSDPKTWGTYEQALSKTETKITHRVYYDKNDKTKFKEYPEQTIAGVGFVFCDNLVGIDIDKCIGNPALEKQADEVINLLNSYTEISPSGDGYHTLIRCDLSKLPENYRDIYDMNPRRHNMECYVSGITKKYFTYTGQSINNFDIEDRTPELIEFLDKYMRKIPLRNTTPTEEKANNESYHNDNISHNDNNFNSFLTDDEIINKGMKEKNGKFSKLFDGNTLGYRSQSEADCGLCCKIGFYCDADFNTIDRIFRQSKLMRPKWDEQHGADTYGNLTINLAINKLNQEGKFYSNKKTPGRPKSDRRSDERGDNEKITIAGVKKHLDEIGVSVKYNETIGKAEIQGFEDYNENYLVDSFPVILYDQLNLIYEKCPKGDVQDFLKSIMMNNAYNPVLEMIEGGKWDGVDRLPELFRIMRIDDGDKLSKILTVKWLWQNLSMLRNYRGEFGADGLLVLKGGQAVGKTTFARKMALKNVFFGESIILDVRNKDTVINAVSCWIGELGEIESTFKSDINALKGFITQRADNIRVPYGRTAESKPRRTSFIGTCNSDEYLIDETGNRRYWTVPINERMDLDALEKLDVLQLYLQIDERAKNDIQGFRLTVEENIALAERNSVHEKPLKGEFEIRDILFRAEKDNLLFEEMTVTEFKELYPALKIYSANQLGIALKKSGIEPEVKKKDGKAQRLSLLPRPKIFNSSDF